MGRIVNIQFYKVTKLWSAGTNVFPVLFVLINCEAVALLSVLGKLSFSFLSLIFKCFWFLGIV